MEPDNTEYFQPSYQPSSLQPVAQPSPTESVWTIPTLPCPPNSTPTLEAELTERLAQADSIAALLGSDSEEDEEAERQRLRVRRLTEQVQEANPCKRKGHGLGKRSKKRD